MYMNMFICMLYRILGARHRFEGVTHLESRPGLCATPHPYLSIHLSIYVDVYIYAVPSGGFGGLTHLGVMRHAPPHLSIHLSIYVDVFIYILYRILARPASVRRHDAPQSAGLGLCATPHPYLSIHLLLARRVFAQLDLGLTR